MNLLNENRSFFISVIALCVSIAGVFYQVDSSETSEKVGIVSHLASRAYNDQEFRSIEQCIIRYDKGFVNECDVSDVRFISGVNRYLAFFGEVYYYTENVGVIGLEDVDFFFGPVLELFSSSDYVIFFVKHVEKDTGENSYEGLKYLIGKLNPGSKFDNTFN